MLVYMWLFTFKKKKTYKFRLNLVGSEMCIRHCDELMALRLHRAGRELTSLRTRARDEAENRSTLAAAESKHTTSLARFDAEVVAAEAELAVRGGDDLGGRLVRFEAVRERGRGVWG